jgi:hypothetical protein
MILSFMFLALDDIKSKVMKPLDGKYWEQWFANRAEGGPVHWVLAIVVAVVAGVVIFGAILYAKSKIK